MRKIQLLLLAVMFSLAANAQLFNIGGVGIGYFYAGPKLGGNASFNTVEVGSGIDKKANFGGQFGAVAKLGITEKLSIQPELVYTTKGFGIETSFIKGHTNYKYFGLPVIVKYAFIAIKGVDVYGSGGFYTDYLTGGVTKVEFVDGGSEPDQEITDFSTYNRMELGLNAGGGANIDLKNNDKLNIDLRFTYAMTNVQNSDAANQTKKNVSIQLSAIYLFDMTRWISFGGANKTKTNDAYEENSAPVGGSKVE